MNNTFFARFMPKEPKFIALLTELAQTSAEASAVMVECVKNTDTEKDIEYAKRIKAWEKKGDNTLSTIFNELNTTFITPFDREDIHNLANCLDDVTDYLNSCAKKIVVYRQKQLPGKAETIVGHIDKATIMIVEAVKGLANIKKNAKNIRQICADLYDIENNVDDIYEDFLSDLFANEQDVKEIIKLKGIMQALEKSANAVENVGKAIKTIIIKYA